MRRFVQDDEVPRVPGHLHATFLRIEQPSVATGGAARGLLDDEAAVARPAKADLRAQDRERPAHQAAHPLGPIRIVGPGANRDGDRLTVDDDAVDALDVGARAVTDQVHEVRERLVDPARLKDHAPVGDDCLLRDLARLRTDLEARRKYDLDRAARRAIGRECPDRKGDERFADPNLARWVTPGIDEIEAQVVGCRLATEQTLAKVQAKEGVVVGPLGDVDRRGAAALPAEPEPRRVRQHGQKRAVEVVALRHGVAQSVGQGHGEVDPHPMLSGLDVVAGGSNDGQVGLGSTNRRRDGRRG